MSAACALISSDALAQQDIPTKQKPAVWYRADKVVTDSHEHLKVLVDSSGNGRNILPGPNAPLVVDNVVNGKPVMRFNGSESPLINSEYDWSKNGFCLFVVAACADGPGTPRVHPNHRNIETPGKALVSDGGGNGLTLGINWTGRPGAVAIENVSTYEEFAPPYETPCASDIEIAPGNFYAFAYASSEGKQNKTADNWTSLLDVSVYVNGHAASTAIHPSVSMQGGSGGLQIAAKGEGQRFKGDIAEILVFDSELSDDERNSVFEYLKKKYSLHEKPGYLLAAPVTFSPSFDNDVFWFEETVSVVLTSPTSGSKIRYTTDGSVPQTTSTLYTSPIKLTATTVIQARAFASPREPSSATSAKFIRIEPAKTTAHKLNGGWKYSWGDEFNGPEVDERIWGYETGYVRNSEAQIYTTRKENSRIDDGNLLIQGLNDNWEGHEWTSASRATQNKVKLTYGRYEFRAKVDIRSGSWPAWWMFSRPDAAGWPLEGEIDMMECYRGMSKFNIMDGRENWYGGNQSLVIASLGGSEWANAFHVWAMDWTADSIKLYLDGSLIVDYPVKDADGTGPNGVNPFRTPETKMIVINQALGGTYGGPLNPKDAPFELRVDWMRVHTWSDEPAYTLTVNAGSGTGPYVIGTRVSIDANMPPNGFVFDKWVGNMPIANPGDPSTTVMMPASDVTLTSVYKKK